MYKSFFAVFYLTFLVSCHCQKINKEENVSEVTSEKIKTFLREENFDILENVDVVIVYEIKKMLAKGGNGEYSNSPPVLKDTLEKKKAKKLLTFLKDDTSYNWTSEEVQTNFDPTLQLLIKNDRGRIFLFVDQKVKKIGFTNMGGQRVIRLSSSLSKYLKDF